MSVRPITDTDSGAIARPPDGAALVMRPLAVGLVYREDGQINRLYGSVSIALPAPQQSRERSAHDRPAEVSNDNFRN